MNQQHENRFRGDEEEDGRKLKGEGAGRSSAQWCSLGPAAALRGPTFSGPPSGNPDAVLGRRGQEIQPRLGELRRKDFDKPGNELWAV